MSRKAFALVVGINYYKVTTSLYGSVNDAHSVEEILVRHSNGEKNFDVQLLVARDEQGKITRKKLKEQLVRLFNKKADIVLFYFSGHGYIENSGGYLITSECQSGDEGLSLHELLQMANNSPANDKMIVLDCCYSGYLGQGVHSENHSILSEGLTILTASSKKQYAVEKNGSGIFTTLFVDALNGSAANLVGDITPGSVYAHIDQSLAWWEQRPIFKTNVSNFTSLRRVRASIKIEELKQITKLFDSKDAVFKLDPTYEPERPSDLLSDLPSPDPESVKLFKLLQRLNRINLVEPVGAPHMYHAAMESKECRLTVLGKHYWHLVNRGRI